MSVRWPLVRNLIRRQSVSNTFGMVRHHQDGSPKPHQGWDFAAHPGTNCFAIADGEVRWVGNHGDFGIIVVHSFVFNGKAFYAAYAHLLSAYVAVGQKVSKDQLIALTGKSGNAINLPSEEMHLHFEIRTVPMPGLGLAGRISPLKIYGVCPLKHMITCPVTLQPEYDARSSRMYA